MAELKIMTCSELANFLGVKLATIYAYLHYKRFPPAIYRKLGRRALFIYPEVEKWVLDGCKLNDMSMPHN